MAETNRELAVNKAQAKEAEREIDLMELFYRLLDHWKMILLIGVLCAAAAAVITHFFITPKYKSTAKIYVLTSSDSVVNLSDLQLGTYLASDYKEVFFTREVNEQVISNLGLPTTFENLSKQLTINNPSGTRILEITVESPDPQQATDIANEFAKVASDYVMAVMLTDRPTVLSAAVPSEKPSSPSMVKNIAIGAVLGVLAVIAIITVSVITDDKIRSADDLTKLTGLPVFAQIPDTEMDERAELIKPEKPMKAEEKKPAINKEKTAMPASSHYKKGDTNI